MQIFPPTLILRHRRENLKKCSLRGLENRQDFRFYSYPEKENGEVLPSLASYIHFAVDAPPLTKEDGALGFFFIDSTWRLAQPMEKYVEKINVNLVKRSLPSHYRTAYPRIQTGCPDPERGLATLEAIYLAYLISGRSTDGLLDNYYWKEEFLRLTSNLE